MRRKLSRTSCLTVRDRQPLWRSSARVVGRTPAGFTRLSPVGDGSTHGGQWYCRQGLGKSQSGDMAEATGGLLEWNVSWPSTGKTPLNLADVVLSENWL